MRTYGFAAFAALILLVLFAPASASTDTGIEFRSLDGGGNNIDHPDWGRAGTDYARVAPPAYADGIGAMEGGPPARYVSNRIFNDMGQNLFSENDVSQMGWLWGQFIDHTLDLRDENPDQNAPIPFDSSDPLEFFNDDFGVIDFARTPGDPLTGTDPTNPRQQINTVNSFIDAWNVYGGTAKRLDWLRAGIADGDPTNNSAKLMLPNNYLPFANARNDVSAAPTMDLMGPLMGHPENAMVAGDVRANENIGLTGMQTLFAREHNRIVSKLNGNPLTSGFSSQLKFDIARRVVGAEEQYITYNEFLPAMGVHLPAYQGYNPSVDPSIANEFATVGFRAHSQIHGEMEPLAGPNAYTADQLAAFQNEGITVDQSATQTHLVIPLSFTFGNPQLLTQVGVGPLLKGLAAEKQYKNDEQFDNQLRSVLFEIPTTDTTNCLDLPDPNCFSDVSDLAAIDVARGRDHGMPTYNQLRQAYHLPVKTSFTDVTGESNAAFPAGMGPNDKSSLLFDQLRDTSGNLIPLDNTEDAVVGLRGSTLAARLQAIYGSVDNLDAFVGMVCEPHLPGSELGELQNAIWTTQFAALRDGDRFFYANDAYLNSVILGQYGIDYRQTLAQVIENDSNANVQDDVFKAPVEPGSDSTGLVGAYSFDEGSGVTVNDSSGRGDPGVVSNTAWTAGKYGSALSFNGFSSKVTIPDNGPFDVTGGVTAEAWIKPTALGSVWRSVIFKAQPNWLLFALYANDPGGRPFWQISMHGQNDSTNAIGAVGSVPLYTWTYLASTYNGSVETLYINGVPVATTPLSGPLPVTSTPLQIGNSFWGEWFKGSIDEVRIYNRALSQSEIQTDMTTPVSAIQLGLHAPPVVGEPHVLGGLDSDAAGTAEAFPSVASATGSVENIHVYVDAASAATRLVAGIYADNGGHPGTLLAAGSLSSPAPGTWNTVAVPAFSVNAGTLYWIAILGRGGKLVFRDLCCAGQGSGPSESNANTFLSQLPATWTTGPIWNADAPLSAYGTG